MILVPVLTTSLIHFSLKGWENVLFELGSERVKVGQGIPTVVSLLLLFLSRHRFFLIKYTLILQPLKKCTGLVLLVITKAHPPCKLDLNLTGIEILVSFNPFTPKSV